MLKEIGLVVLGAVLGTLFSWLVPEPQQPWVWAFFAMVTLALLALNSYFVFKTYSRVRKPAPSVTVYAYKEADRGDMYAKLRQMVSRAKKSIFALSYHVDSPDPGAPSMRKYYQHIEAVVDSRKREGFEYVRVFQMPEDRDEVSAEVVGQYAADHADWILESRNKNGNLPVYCMTSKLQIQASILIIDNEIALIGLIKPTNKGQILSINIVIEDPSQKELAPILGLVESIKKEANMVPRPA